MIPDFVLNLFDGMLLVSFVLCVFRMALGPTSADRMVAIDLLGLLAAVLMISHAIRSGDESVLDVVLVFSVVAFFGTVTLARYLQRESDEPTDPR
jgi:multicomponent Na+:H+ antiporter subunit F